ncbi:carbohydrate-binding module family 14 protein [Streptomyces sp. NPDC094049]|uniref:carbohydrate-binding module family 14 protein n=1 Tax=Streptomyces sp. NPDC094049 TaxID=3154987 RepID=UPI00331DF19F
MVFIWRFGIAVAAVALLSAAGSVPASAEPTPTAAAAKCRDGAKWPDGDAPRWFFHCSNGVGYRKVCPANLYWLTYQDTCGWPQEAVYDTRLTAGRAAVEVSPKAVRNLHARLVVAGTGDGTDATPVERATLTFRTTTGETLCTAQTDFEGTASCDATGPIRASLDSLKEGYEVGYAGNDAARPSSTHGDIGTVAS